MKPSKSRTEENLAQLVPLIKTIQFFKERDIRDADFPDIVSCLTYESFEQGQDVFRYGKLALDKLTFTFNRDSRR